MRILLLEDDVELQNSLKTGLQAIDYTVDIVKTISEARTIDYIQYDLVILDLTLPDGDSIQLCKEIRRQCNMPVIFLTANMLESKMIEGLNAGADDYITKPVSLRVLDAKIKSMLRRFDTTTYIGDLMINFENYMVFKDGNRLELTNVEYAIIFEMLSNKAHLLTREQLCDIIYKTTGNDVETNTVTVYMKRIRDKLGTYEGNAYIETVRGIGYRLNDGK